MLEDNGRGFTPPDSRSPQESPKGFGLLGNCRTGTDAGGAGGDSVRARPGIHNPDFLKNTRDHMTQDSRRDC